jgi:tRNA(adenine34) deaminase
MTIDEMMIGRCIQLAEDAVQAGDSPFGALIACGSSILVESGNRMRIDNDITAHAEILVIRQAQKINKSSDLSRYTLYSNCEPCPMCSFMAREAKFHKIVFALKSRYMGGLSRWNILHDPKLEHLKPYFSKAPKVVAGVLEKEAVNTFRKIGWEKFF